MISKNKPCPCGSGKLYKRCHGLVDNGKKAKHIFENYDTCNIIQLLSALTLYPRNHGKNLRLENLTRLAAIHINRSNKKIPIDTLKKYVAEEFAVDPMEDATCNLFSELIFFHGGDYLVLPGLYDAPSFVLNSLLMAIYHWPHSNLDSQFKINAEHYALAILTISDHVMRKADYGRYLDGDFQEEKIAFPNEALFNRLIDCTYISNSELHSLLKSNRVSIDAIEPFIVDLADKRIKDWKFENSPLELEPFIQTTDGLIVASPSSLCFALIECIKKSAGFNNQTAELYTAYHETVWNQCKMHLSHLHFNNNIDDLEKVQKSEGCYFSQFDDDKIAILQYFPLEGNVSLQEFAIETERIIQDIKSNAKYTNCEFLCITVLSSMMSESMIAFPAIKGGIGLFLQAPELETLVQSHSVSSLDIWQFVKAREEQVPRVARLAPLTFLDQFTIFRRKDDSFYLSDEGFDMSQWMYGTSHSFVTNAKRRNDEHCMIIAEKPMLSPVIKQDKYTATYLSPHILANKELKFFVEGFSSSICVYALAPKRPTPKVSHFYWLFTEAIAYWLWQMNEYISSYFLQMNKKYVEFTFELTSPEEFDAIDQDLERNPQIEDLCGVKLNGESIYLKIPADIMPYFYGQNNEGDRLLVKLLLKGLSLLLTQSGGSPINSSLMDKIVDTSAPLGHKKKLVVLHSKNNMLLDNTHVSKPRYIQSYESNRLLNAATNLLGTKAPSPGEITDSSEKNKLLRNLVMSGLLPFLKKTLKQYDVGVLLKKLISQNENLINKREHFRIMTPTRIACFVNQKQHTADMVDEFNSIERTSLATRCLIEHLAAEQTQGSKSPSITDTDELIAIMDAIIYWGSLGDQLRYRLLDIPIGVLKTGRIGTGKIVANEIFSPYYFAKTAEKVQDALDSFSSQFPLGETEINGKEFPQYLDRAFEDELGLSLSRLFHFLDILADQGFQQDSACAMLTKSQVANIVNQYPKPLTKSELETALRILTLEDRGSVEAVPPGFEPFDISPWRFNRRLSLFRRPIIQVQSDGKKDPMLLWGPRQTILSRITILDQCINNRFKCESDGPIQKALSRLNSEQGSSLVTAVAKILKTADTIIDTEITIAPKGKITNAEDIGDIDVLVLVPGQKIFFALECKSLAPSRNPHEMVAEIERLTKDRLIEKHERRDKWITANMNRLGAYLGIDLTGYTAIFAFVTREQMLLPFIAASGIKMPFITLYDIEGKGVDALTILV